MPNSRGRLTAADSILLAAADLTRDGRSVFSEWDLSVSAWKREPNRFGCRGYEDEYPDHKRVMMEIMGQTKKENPVRRGLLEKVRPNYYRLTSLGLAEAERVAAGDRTSEGLRSAQPIYSAVEGYVFHPVFRRHLDDADEPRTWLGVQAFLKLTNADDLDVHLRRVRDAAQGALGFLDVDGRPYLRSGSSGGGKAISREDLRALLTFLETLEHRFAREFGAIRSRTTRSR